MNKKLFFYCVLLFCSSLSFKTISANSVTFQRLCNNGTVFFRFTLNPGCASGTLKLFRPDGTEEYSNPNFLGTVDIDPVGGGTFRYQFNDNEKKDAIAQCPDGERRASTNTQNTYYTTGDQKANQENIITISKNDENNQTSWQKTYGTTGYNTGLSIATDPLGNNIATGGIQNTVDFDTQTFTSYGNSDIFLVKNDQNGNELWAIQAGSSAKDVGKDILIDPTGTSFLVGQYGATADFGGQVLAHTGTGAKGFIASHNANGILKWVQAIAGTGANVVNSIAQNEQGDLFITGFFNGSATFGDETVDAINGTALFVAKMDENGNFLWVKTYENGTGVAITADIYGNVIVAGKQDDQMLLLKYSSTGVLAAERLIRSTEILHVQDITTKGNGTIQVIGQFKGTILIDNTTIPSLGGLDIFLGEFNGNLATNWAKGEGGTLDDYGLGIYNECTGFTSYVGCHFGTSTINGETTTAPSGSFMPFSTRVAEPCSNENPLNIDESNTLEAVLGVLPNPFNDYIAIELNTAKAENLDVQLIDLLGRTVHQKTYKANTGRQTVNIELGESLSQGIYLLQVTDDKGRRFTKKMLH